MKKTGQVIMLPTNGESPLHYKYDEGYKYAPDLGFDLFDTSKNFQHRPHHLYITDNSAIKEGDYIISFGILAQTNSTCNFDELNNHHDTKKVIASTNPNLFVLTTKMPLISKDFIKEFVDSSGQIKKVEVEYDSVLIDFDTWEHTIATNNNNEVIISLTEKDKVINRLIKEKNQKLYTLWELKQKMFSSYVAGKMFKTEVSVEADFEEWFKLNF